MDENEITQRLRDAGRQQVPGDVRAHHVTRMQAAAPTVERPKRFGRLAVAAAAIVGFTVGSTGFAMAGALPEPAQQVAHDVLSVVKVNVESPKANRGQCISNAARTIEDEGEKQAAKQACKDTITPGRPDHAGEGRGNGKGRPDHAGVPGGPNGGPDGDPCKGPPPWAGKGAKGLTPGDKEALKADRAAACGRELDADDDPAAEAAEDAAEAAEDAAEAEREAAEDAAEAERDAAEDAAEAERERQAEAEQPQRQGQPSPPATPTDPGPEGGGQPGTDSGAGTDAPSDDTEPTG